MLTVVPGVLSLNAQAVPDTLTLHRVISLALKNNHQIRISELEGHKLLMQERELRSRLMPNVEAYSTLSYFYAIPRMVIPGEIFGLTGNIPVEFGTKFDWNSGLRFSQLIYHQNYFTSLKMIDELIALQELSQQQQREEIVYQASTLFNLCLTIKDQINAFDSTIHSMTRLQSIVQLHADNGIARKADVERVVIDISKLEIEKLRLSEKYMQEMNLLKIITGMDPRKPIYAKGACLKSNQLFWTSDSESYYRIELQMNDKQRSAKELALSMEKQSRWPVLAAFGQHYYLGMRDQFDFFDGGDDRFFKSGLIGLQLRVPLFCGFEKQSRIKTKEIELSQIETRREHLLMTSQSEFLEAEQEYKNSLTTLSKEAQNLEAARCIYLANLSGYKQQIVTLTDLILSEYQLTKTRMEFFGAQFNVKRTELTLKKITGTLISDIYK